MRVGLEDKQPARCPEEEQISGRHLPEINQDKVSLSVDEDLMIFFV